MGCRNSSYAVVAKPSKKTRGGPNDKIQNADECAEASLKDTSDEARQYKWLKLAMENDTKKVPSLLKPYDVLVAIAGCMNRLECLQFQQVSKYFYEWAIPGILSTW